MTYENRGASEGKLLIYLLGLAFILFGFMVAGIITYMVNFSNQALGLSLAYLAGLSMLFLPSTLPLVLIIAPIAMNESPRKGIMMALFFGAGMLITSTLYEVALVYAGGAMDLLIMTMIPVIVGGGWVYILGLSELGLINMNILGLESVSHAAQKHGDYLEVFLIGFSLANVTFWYQNPIFYFLHMNTADILTRWSIIVAYDVGKVSSLIFILTLGIIGINVLPGIKKVIVKPGSNLVKKVTDWGLVFVGAFLVTLGGIFRRGYNESAIYGAWNDMLIALSEGRVGEVETFSTKANDMLQAIPQWLGLYVFILLLAIPIILHFYKNSQKFTKFKQNQQVNLHDSDY